MPRQADRGYLDADGNWVETEAQRDRRTAWWRDARFGMFIHWGLYSVTAGQWQGKWRTSKYGEWSHIHFHIPVKEYESAAGRFNPVKFDADAWVRVDFQKHIDRKAMPQMRELSTHRGPLVLGGLANPLRRACLLADAARKPLKTVRDGGGYVGICGGAFLSSANYEWSLALINNKTIPGRLHERGGGTIHVELTDEGRRTFGGEAGPFDCRYRNGPMFLPAGVEGLPKFTALAMFRSELCKYEEQKGTMIDRPAIIAAPFGKGRVLAISPHPESVPALHFIITQGVQWVAGRRQAATPRPACAVAE